MMKPSIKIIYLLGLLFGAQVSTAQTSKPNIIFIMTDDQGYGDLGSYGSKDLMTPNIDKMAKDGIQFTDYYAAANVCTPSRAGVLTGCYPQRIGMSQVLFPSRGPAYIEGKNNIGFNPEEQTIPELLRDNGYKTACSGKWHLGHLREFLPLQHGFDEYLGIPYSHDMYPGKNPLFPALPLVKGNETVLDGVPLEELTSRFTDFSVDFINRNKSNPFFLYLTYSMPHIPLAVSSKYDGATGKGLYADVIYEIDMSVGQIIKALKDNGIEENTLIIFTSDNGPWLKYGNHGGTAGPLKAGKGTTYDGGHRVPFVAQWKGTIKKGQICSQPLSATDILPTFAALTKSKLPLGKIDGHNRSDLFLGGKAGKEIYPIYFYSNQKLDALRYGDYKYHFKHQYDSITVVGRDGKSGKSMPAVQPEALYKLTTDRGEKNNLIEKQKDMADKLKQMGLAFDAEINKNQRANGAGLSRKK
jgi:arylsulfatase